MWGFVRHDRSLMYAAMCIAITVFPDHPLVMMTGKLRSPIRVKPTLSVVQLLCAALRGGNVQCTVSIVRCHHVTSRQHPSRHWPGLALHNVFTPVGNHVAPGPRVDVNRRLGLAPWAVRTTLCGCAKHHAKDLPKEDPVSASEYSGPAWTCSPQPGSTHYNLTMHLLPTVRNARVMILRVPRDALAVALVDGAVTLPASRFAH